jgi:hypothetical protein
MAPKDGKALMMMTLAPGNNLQEAASTVAKQFGLQVTESRSTTINGLNALTMLADQVPQQQQQQSQQQQQQRVRTLSTLIQYNNAIYLLIGVAGANDFNNYTGFFNSTMQNFKVLTDAAKINKSLKE